MLEKIVRKIVGTVFRVLHIKLNDSKMDAFIQFCMFGLVGVTNTAISYVLNIIVLLIMKPFDITWDYIVGNTVGFILSVLWSFYWNNRLVFKLENGQKRNMWKALLKTYLSYGFTGIILSNVLSYVWIEMLGIPKYIAPLINLIISVPVNFVLNKLWAFKSDAQ